MDEHEYKATYQALNECRCIFEKALNTRRCACARSRRFNLADREGVACIAPAANVHCRDYLLSLRRAARFALRLEDDTEALPHAKALRLQMGGLLGLRRVLGSDEDASVAIEDAGALIDEALARFGALESFPYETILREVVAFKGRRGRTHRG